jgi:hypothetical protein
MPDDNLFPDKPDVPAGGPPAKPNGQDSGESPVTVELAAEMVAQGVTQGLTPLAERLEEVSQTLTKLQQPASPNPPPKADPPGDFLTEFSEDPEAAIDKRAMRPIEQIMPLFSNFLNSAVSGWTSLEANKIDQEFGPGAWDKFFNKPMSTILDNYKTNNAAALSDNSVITKEVNGLKGVQFNELVEFREASQKKAAEETDENRKTLVDGVLEQLPRTNLMGGLRRTPDGTEEVPEGLKEYLEERARVIGTEAPDPKTWLKERDYGNSIEDYQKHQEKLAAAKGGK